MWSFGIFLYELVVGQPPFGSHDSDLDHMRTTLMRDEIRTKDYFSKDFQELIFALLEKNTRRRLTIDGVFKHPFFKKVNW
jgi:serine/threonine-protein kinase HSL1, negative regulator of Swe1 kinase